MSQLPYSLYSAEQSRELDRIAIEERGIPGTTLMERAGKAAFDVMCRHWPSATRILVLCGGGNNGGDGYILARLAHAAEMEVTVVAIAEASSEDALVAKHKMEEAGLTINEYRDDLCQSTDIIVDGLFGTGLQREVTGTFRRAIEAINTAKVPVLALDIPSGLHTDCGSVQGIAVKAQVTVTFISLKVGLFIGRGRVYVGRIEFADLELPGDIQETQIPIARRINPSLLINKMPMRSQDAHKNHCGHLLVIGGDHGMAGAVRMTSEAAYRSGTGLVTLATRESHAAVITSALPEVMSRGLENVEQLSVLLPRANTIAIGPGMGQGSWGRRMLGAVLETELPMVVDADALNLLVYEPTRRDNWVLTPHPGEAARLLQSNPAEVQQDRLAAVKEIVSKYGGVCVLKGAGTLIAGEQEGVTVCDAGNAGMATAGMGDVLTGVISGLVAQGAQLNLAAQLGVWLHARAGDHAASLQGPVGMLATDLMPFIRQELNHLVAPQS